MLVVAISSLVMHSFPLILAGFPFAGVAFALWWYVRAGERWSQLSQQREFYEGGLSRLNGTWRGQGNSGDEFARDNHLYQWDLNVLGAGSLFELLVPARSEVGTSGCASYLLDPVTLDETKERLRGSKGVAGFTRAARRDDSIAWRSIEGGQWTCLSGMGRDGAAQRS